jgi:hypothetical protein
VTLVELKDIQLPDSMQRAMARQAEAEREKRAKIINAEGESLAAAALGEASDTMMAHPLALQLRNLQSLVEIGVDKNTTVVFPAPLMSTIAELGSFLASEQAAATRTPAARQRHDHAAGRAGRTRRTRRYGVMCSGTATLQPGPAAAAASRPAPGTVAGRGSGRRGRMGPPGDAATALTCGRGQRMR